MTAQAIEHAALHLPKLERAHLARLLLESLDSPSASENQEVWLAESQRWAAEIDEGLVTLVTLDQGEAFNQQFLADVQI